MASSSLTWTCLAGDAHVGVLARMLKSILVRPGGPSCSEVVIGWNGENHEGFAGAIEDALGSMAGIADFPPDNGRDVLFHWKGRVNFIVFRQAWTGDFARARNETLVRATSTWVGYIDCDDQFLLPDDPRVRAALDDEPLGPVAPVPFVGTLEDILGRLPGHINVVKCPYSYVLAPVTGKPLLRKRRPRIVRRDPYWSWIETVHEVYRHALDREVPAWLPGLVLVHDPPQTQQERGQRNFEILKEQLASLPDGKPVTSMQSYGLACQAFDAGAFKHAVQLYTEAADLSADHEQRLLNLSMACRVLLETDHPREAGEKALKAIETAPARPEGYLIACEAEFALRRYAKCVQWYETGGKLPLPNAAMIDDRIERCMRPVRHAGVAYLRMGRYAEALEVAEAALKLTPEPFAEQMASWARIELRRGAIEEAVRGVTDTLVKEGFPLSARRVVRALSGVLHGGKLEATVAAEVETQMENRGLQPISPESPVGVWLAGTAGYDVALTLPLDATDDPLAVLASLAEGAKGAVHFCVTDPAAGDEYAVAMRADALPAPQVLALAETIGAVEELSLIEGGFLGCRVVPPRGPAWVPDFTFWCPRFMESWGPWRLLRDGTGGSEEAVIYLANELAARGYNVQVFAPLDTKAQRGVHVQQRVRWYTLEALDTLTPIPGISIACRAPDAIGLPCFDLDRLYLWHQDAGYRSGWTAARATAIRNLFVSKWQRASLLKQVGLTPKAPESLSDDFGLICGDAIPASAGDWGTVERRPLDCAYLSSPLRGLGNLLDLWPDLIRAVPEARLHVFYGWETAPPELRALRERMMLDVQKGGPTVIWRGRLPQRELEVELPKFGAWLYPCGFPEGFCIAGVRATAAGCVPVYRQVAAMAEIQYPSPFAVGEVDWLRGGRVEFLDAAIAALRASRDGTFDREAARAWALERTWDRVADAIELDLARRGIVPGCRKAVLDR